MEILYPNYILENIDILISIVYIQRLVISDEVPLHH